MNIGLTATRCPKCNEEGCMTVTVEEAAHDAQLLDIVVECASCNARANSFVSVDEMDELE